MYRGWTQLGLRNYSTHLSRAINTDILNPKWVVNIASTYTATNTRVVNSYVQCLGSSALTSAITWWFINTFNFSFTCSNKPNVRGSSYNINLGRVIKISVLSQLHLFYIMFKSIEFMFYGFKDTGTSVIENTCHHSIFPVLNQIIRETQTNISSDSFQIMFICPTKSKLNIIYYSKEVKVYLLLSNYFSYR